MKHRAAIFFFLLVTSLATAVAQNQKKIEGTWKIIVLSDDEIYYDVKKDSLSLPARVGVDSAVIRSFFSMFAELRDMLYVFQKDGRFQHMVGGKTDGEGEYTVDTKNSLITMRGKRNGVNFTEKMKYRFKNDLLILIEEDGSGPQMTLEKQK